MLKNRIIFVIAIIGVGLLDYYYNSYVLDVLFFALLAIIPIAIISLLITLSNIEINIESNKIEYKKGEYGILMFNIINTGGILISGMSFKLFHEFGIKLEEVQTKTPAIFAKETYRYECDFYAMYRGEYEIGVKDIYITDYFNLLRGNIKKRVAIKVLYLPNIIPIKHNQESISNSEDENQFGIDFVEQDVLVDIRQYEYGDPLKKIHWKLSAKNNELLVKKYSSNKEKKLSVIIDTLLLEDVRKTARIVIEDQIIETAIGLIWTSLQNKTKVRVTSSVSDSHELGHINDFGGLYKHLAKYRFKGHNDAYTLVQAYFEDNEEKLLTDTNNIFIVTNRPTPELYGLLVENKYGDHKFTIYCLLYSTQKSDFKLKELMTRMSETGITIKEIWI
jgi:uncharacterized protein (DUF58 family)